MPCLVGRRTVLAFAVMFAGAIRTSAGEDLTGIWSAESRSRGGLGQQMIFTSREVQSTFGALIDLRYEIDGTLFKMIGPGSPPADQMTGLTFRIEGNTLTIDKALSGQPLVMTRVGSPHSGTHPIVGDWTYTHQTGAAAIQRFSRSGAMQLVVAMESMRGLYDFADGTMTLRFEGRLPIALKVTRDNKVLITTDPTGRQARFMRFDY